MLSRRILTKVNGSASEKLKVCSAATTQTVFIEKSKCFTQNGSIIYTTVGDQVRRA